jgi:PAS domain S-box-containing protein
VFNPVRAPADRDGMWPRVSGLVLAGGVALTVLAALLPAGVPLVAAGAAAASAVLLAASRVRPWQRVLAAGQVLRAAALLLPAAGGPLTVPAAACTLIALSSAIPGESADGSPVAQARSALLPLGALTALVADALALPVLVVLAAALLAAGSLHTPARGGPLGPKRVALLALLPVLPPLALLAPQPPPAAVAVLGTVLASALVAMRLREAGHLAVEVERRHGADRQATLSSAAGTVVLILDDAGRVAESSGSLWGRTPEEVLGHTPDALVAPDDAGRVRALVADAITGRNGGALPTRVRGGDGQWRHVEVVATDLRAAPEVGGLTLILRTLATTGELDRQLVHHAFQDPLTGLPNRELFGDRVAHALARQQRGDGKAAILAVDLDDFRAVNAALGTAAGDALLIAVAERVESCLRDGDTAARLGGDAFAVLL